MKKQIGGMAVKKVLALAVTAAMGPSSAAFAVEAATTPAPIATTIRAAPVKTTYHKKQHKATPAQRAQTAKKHHKDARVEQRAPGQKAQMTKKHVKKHSHQQPAKPAARSAA